MTDLPIAVVTGGAGFIGSHMVDVLVDRGFNVRVIDNLVGGREQNLAHHAGTGRVAFSNGDIRDVQPNDALFEGARYDGDRPRGRPVTDAQREQNDAAATRCLRSAVDRLDRRDALAKNPERREEAFDPHTRAIRDRRAAIRNS